MGEFAIAMIWAHFFPDLQGHNILTRRLYGRGAVMGGTLLHMS